jgi:hypothetical protein
MKMKDKLLQDQQLEFELELAYREWLRDNFKEPSESDIDNMEQDYIIQPYYRGNRILSERALNNPDYCPIIGA